MKSSQKKNYKTNIILATMLLATSVSCTKTNFSPVPGSNSSLGVTEEKTTTFDFSAAKNPKVDILFIIDNSDSMVEEQAKISDEFRNFISQISNVDWRIAITTTDNSNSGLGNQGQFLNFTPGVANTFMIDSKTPNGLDLFKKTINTGIDGSPTETGFFSIAHFIQNSYKGGTPESQFLRADADFHTIVVSDSDQAQIPENYYKPSLLIQEVQTRIKANKYVNHSFVDNNTGSCESEMVGSSYIELSKLTKGTVSSICIPNYASNFKLVADNIKNEKIIKVLDCIPRDTDGDGVPDIKVLGPSNHAVLGFSLSGNQITFTQPLVEQGKYKIQYQCAK